jgi:SAM-dependent methyltransferase
LRFTTDPNCDFERTGREFVSFLIQYCGLRPDHAVLDVGCGIGRIAVALTSHLNAAGRYEGIDIVPEQIAWCQRHVSGRFPNFRFHLANVYNLAYNPKGTVRASEYRFPFDDDTFDAVVLASLFTHMLSRDLERYVKEVARVLKKGGRCFVSFYLLNDESRKNITEGTSAFGFKNRIDDCSVEKAGEPEAAVAHDEDRVRDLLARSQLAIDFVFYGTWSSTRSQGQDLLVVSRVG